MYFHLYCPTNPETFDREIFMFNNGTIYGDLNFKAICPVRQKEQVARISFQQSWSFFVWPNGQMIMEDFWYFALSNSLIRASIYDRICMDWEILKLFFLTFNVSPYWIVASNFLELEPFYQGTLEVDLIKDYRIASGRQHPQVHVASPINYAPLYIWSRYQIGRAHV